MYRKTFNNQKAFAFSADIILALILVTSLLVFISFPTQPSPQLEERRITDQFVDDVFVALDHSGYVAHEIDVNGFSTLTLTRVHTRAKTYLPTNYDLFLQLKSYPVDIADCQTYQNFDECFPDANVSTLSYGSTLPPNAAFVHGRRIFLKQQPASQCTSSLSPSQNGSSLLYPAGGPLALQSSPDLNIQFDVNVTPGGALTCDQNITVTLSVTAATGARRPVDMMLVFDRSGSMSYESQVSTTNPQGVHVDGNIVYVADGTAGLRDFNILNPGLPNLIGTYNSPGTARDVSVNNNYAYLADGTQGLRVVNVTNPASPASVANRVLGNDAYASASNGTRTYIATTSSTTTDISNTGNTNNEYYIGRSATQQYAGQSIQPAVSFITGVMVRINRVGSPVGDVTVSIRSTLTGSDLATTTIPRASITTSYQNLTATFPSAASVTAGGTYYIVLTTSTNDASNYYRWGATNNNSYGNGQPYQNTTAQSGDARFETYYVGGLIAIDTSTPASPVILGATTLTDPWRIFVNGTTAYVADGTAGLRIFDVSGNTPVLQGTYNTNGTAYDVFVSGTTAYVSDGTAGLVTIDVTNPAAPTLLGTYNTPGTAYATRVSGTTAYVADGSSIHVLNIATPSSPTLLTSYATPWNYRDMETQNGWAYLNVSSGIVGLMTVNLANGPKINQAKLAATTFVDFNAWDSDNDQIGLVSYSSTATTDQTLTQTYSLVRSDINTLTANGGTATGDGINAATTELNSVRHNPNALKFQVLMSDGLTNTGANSTTAAITARNSGITIFTIAFGADADESELQNIATITGGQSYLALDQNALIDVYALIAQQIQLLATDANLFTTYSTGTVIVDDGNGTVGNGTIQFDINTQQAQPWTSTYTFNIPCDSQLACSSTLISIPSPGTQFQYVDVNGDSQVQDWNVYSTQTFQFRDLNIEILSGNLLGPNNTDLDVRVSSRGNLDTNASSVTFYRGDPSFGNVLTSTSIPPMCGELVPGCMNSEYNLTQNVLAEGDLYAVVNPNSALRECAHDNQDVIFCYFTPSTQFFTIDYWAWLRD